MVKIAVVYICTGKYNQFFDGFYTSSEKYFMAKEAKKHYFVFTDDLSLSEAQNVSIVEKKCEGFPLDSLMRFKLFLSIKEELLKYDYVYFFNSNMLFVEDVSIEILPRKGEIAFTLNAGYYDKNPLRYPYERNKNSTAFIPFKRNYPYRYVIGGLNGGESKDYIHFSEVCNEHIHQDNEKGVLAIYHDESHINRYYYDNGGTLLPPFFAYPEGANLPFKPKILIRDKVKVDSYFDKVVNHSKIARLYKGFRITYQGIKWRANI